MIVDTHTHFYDPTRPQGAPWPGRNEKFLYRPMLPDHYRAVAVPEGVTGTVVVEASEWLEDNQWVLDLAADEPLIVGLVGHIDPGTDNFRGHLDRFAANPLFRGIRVGGAALGELEQPGMLADMEHLARCDLTLDGLIGTDAVPALCELARRLPELRIVINHAAGVRIDGNAPDPRWVECMQQAAEHAGIYCKVSGLAEGASHMDPVPEDPTFYAPTIDVLWEAFGEDRLVYGSNWPVCELNAEYSAMFKLIDEYCRERGDETREKIFWKNAGAFYKWIDRT